MLESGYLLTCSTDRTIGLWDMHGGTFVGYIGNEDSESEVGILPASLSPEYEVPLQQEVQCSLISIKFPISSYSTLQKCAHTLLQLYLN